LTFPKFRDAGAIVNCPAAAVVPVPLRGTLRFGPFEALLVNDSNPETAPLLVGVNAAVKEELCPAAMVNGKETPVRTNCELLLASADSVTLPPVAVI
jgi:hypothetical protein